MSRECPSIWRERYKSLSPCLFFGCVSETKETCHLASTGERKRRKRKKKSSFSFHFHFIFIRRLWSLLYASDTVASRWEKDWHDFSARSETRVFCVFYSEAESLMKKVSACVCVARFPLCRHLFCSANEMLHIYEGPDNIRQVHRHTQRTRFQKHATHLFTFQPFSD